MDMSRTCHEVRRYPMVHFNQPTQRLAVGTAEGVVLHSDTATRQQPAATKRKLHFSHTLRFCHISAGAQIGFFREPWVS